MPVNKHTRNSNGNYGPTSTGHFYISKADHRRTAAIKRRKGVIVKTRWSIDEGEEFDVFKIANEQFELWYCQTNKCLFSFVDMADFVLGQGGERVAKFPDERNLSAAWHGYPVYTDQPQNRPTSEMLDKLFENEKISMPNRLRIERGSL